MSGLAPGAGPAAGTRLGLVTGAGIGWRREIDVTVARLPGIDFTEVVAENVCPCHVPASLRALHAGGVPVIPHGVSLSLGGTEPLDPAKLERLASLATAFGSPLVSEHVAFCRAGGLEAGHLLPVPRTRAGLDVLAGNIRTAQAALPVPLAVENIAPLLRWPEDELTEAEFLSELAERTGVLLLLDVANLHTTRVNLGIDPAATLGALPLERVAYVHVAGGVLRDGVWHDTHAHPVPAEILDVLSLFAEQAGAASAARGGAVDDTAVGIGAVGDGAVPGVLLERDDAYPPDAEIAGELAAIREVLTGAAHART
jgi:hypothetical protein